MAVRLTSCFAVLLLSSTCYAKKGACDIPSVEIGQNTTLTCHYNEEVLKLKEIFIIDHYFSSFKEISEMVLLIISVNETFEYIRHPDYEFHYTNNVIQLEIPRVAKKHAGRYVCLFPHSNGFEECLFTPQEPLDFKYDSISTTHSDITTSHERDSTGEGHPMAIIIGVIAGSTIVIVLLVTAVVYRLKRSRCSSKDVEKTNHEQINTTEQRNDIQYSEVKQQDKSSHDEGFGSMDDVHANTMQTYLGDDHIKEIEERLSLCQNVMPKRESKKIYQKGKEPRHKSPTGEMDITEDADSVISDSSSLSQRDDFSDSLDSSI